MNRHQRRAEAKLGGVPWRRARMAHMMAQGADKAVTGMLQMTPEQARETLAMWAARPGRTQEEVDRLNGHDHVSESPC